MTSPTNTPPEYSIESFTAGMDGTAPDERTAKWFQAVFFGFHDASPDNDTLPKVIESYRADGRILTGAYVADPPAAAWDASMPVATYATMVNAMNIGDGRELPTHLVTAVTVRPTHRRRGLLRKMITADLAQARSEGLAMAALTASEATIYGRFGFGAATFTTSIEIDTRERFGIAAPSGGMVEVADPEVLLDVGPQVFERFHRSTTGSMGRQDAYRHRIAGQWSEEKPEPDKSVRAALHYDDDGRVDGYVSYKFAGWDTNPFTMKVRDLVAATDEAYLALWKYLGAIDLVERIKFPMASLQDPLPWAMSDRRGYTVTGDEDVLWLRILDPVKALEARSYSADGALILDITDPMGWTGGRYRLQASGGQALVEALESQTEDADVALSINALGSLYLGGVSARTLAAAGEVQARTGESLQLLEALFNRQEQPYCITHF